MIDVKELLRRWSAGHSDRKIARESGADRKTIARYTKAACTLGLERGCELTDGVVHQVAQCIQARPLATTSEEWNEVARHRALIERWLAGQGDTRPLRLAKVHALLARDHGLQASYDTLWRFAHQELARREKPSTVRIDDPPPGQEAQIDFGKMGLMLDPESGKKRTLWALIITLVFSRYQYVWPTFRQTTAAVCEGLDRAWMFFRGITPTLIPDNTKAMINDPDALAPTLVAAFLDYVQARGIFVDPARVRSPKDKPRVENQVPFVRESWFDGETFTSLEHACSALPENLWAHIEANGSLERRARRSSRGPHRGIVGASRPRAARRAPVFATEGARRTGSRKESASCMVGGSYANPATHDATPVYPAARSPDTPIQIWPGQDPEDKRGPGGRGDRSASEGGERDLRRLRGEAARLR
jgi:transposase